MKKLLVGFILKSDGLAMPKEGSGARTSDGPDRACHLHDASAIPVALHPSKFENLRPGFQNAP
jgi:hypothetical protein